MTYFRDKANAYSEKFQHNFSVLGTPAEGLSGRFTKMDKKKFGIIKGVTDKDYYTNSSHVPVYFHCTPKRKAEVEAPYHDLERGGHIFYVEEFDGVRITRVLIHRAGDLAEEHDEIVGIDGAF